jgi:U3 small nucleolar RNA-associated protein 6
MAELPLGPSTISDYALVRRQFHVFERALRKFKDDVGLWIQYIHIAKKEGARALVGRLSARYVRLLALCRFTCWLSLTCCTRALQLHPSTPALYILAASHELEHHSPSAARTLLQRGLRLNKDSVELWREYVKMELGFVESVRRRWEVLGISVGGNKGKGKEKAAEGATDDMDVDRDVDAQADADEARVEIMEGAIVRSVITSAAKGADLFICIMHSRI